MSELVVCYGCLSVRPLSDRIEHPKPKKRVNGQRDTCADCRKSKVYFSGGRNE